MKKLRVGHTGAGSAASLFKPATRTSTPGTVAASRSRTLRAWQAIFPAIDNSRSRSRFGSHRRAGTSVNQPDPVLIEPVQRKILQPGRFRCPDPVLAPSLMPVPQLQIRELPAAGVGDERGQPQPVEVGEPQLRTRVVESARSAVPVSPPARFCEPLAEPGVRVSTHRALHGLCHQAWLATTQGFGC